MDSCIQILNGTSSLTPEGVNTALAAAAIPFVPLSVTIQIAAGSIDKHGFVFDAYRAFVWNCGFHIRYIYVNINACMCRQRNGDGIRNGLGIGFLLTAFVGFLHAVGIGKALLYLCSRGERCQNRHAEFYADCGFLCPVLGIGIGNGSGSRGAFFVGVAFFYCIFKIIAVFCRYLIAVGAAAQAEVVTLLLQIGCGILLSYGRSFKSALNSFNFKIIKSLNIVTVTGSVVPIILIFRIPFLSIGRGIINRKFAFRQLIQNIRAVAKSFIVDCLSDSIAQTLSGIFQIVCVIAFFCKIRIIKIFSAYIVICIELGRQNIICDGSPVAGKILVLNHCLQNLLLCFRQTIIICFKNIPVIFSSDLRPCCRRQQPYHHNQRKQAAVYSFYHSIPPF